MADVTKMAANKVLSGTHGHLWINGEKFANVKSFEAKLAGDFEEIKIAEELGTKNKYMGYSISGTIALHKMNSKSAGVMAEGYMTGDIPDIVLVASIEDPAAYGYERIELSDVTFDEMTLLQFETGSVTSEEVPFKAGSFRYLDKIL